MSSTVTCGYSAADWEKNSAGQNSCQVYASLQGLCNPSFTIGDVTPTSAPYTPNNDACSCNIVAYNLMAGCGWCQSSIQTSWWLTVGQWSGNCTTSAFDATGIPSSVTGASQLNIPAWALAVQTGSTWSPSDAQVAAESATPSLTSASATATTGRASTTSNPFSRASTTYNFATYTGPFNGGDDEDLTKAGSNVGKAVGIALGVILALYALLGLVIGLVYWTRQKNRQAWYGPMAKYYRDRGMGMGGPQTMYGGYVQGAGAQAGAPLMYNQDSSFAPAPYPHPPPSSSPNHTVHSTTTGTGATGAPGSVYQPPPQDPSNPFATPYGTPHPTPGVGPGTTGYQPPPPEMGGWGPGGHPGTTTTAGNTTSVYGTAQTNTTSMYAPPPAPPGGYKGHAEVY